MKVFAILCMVLIAVSAGDCPDKLATIAQKNMKNYLKAAFNKKKVGEIKMTCSYDHDSNIFNLEHRVKADFVYDKRKLSFNLTTHSSLFNLYNFTDFNGELCHAKSKSLKAAKDKKLILNTFMRKYSKEIHASDLVKTDRKNKVCYRADISKKSRRKRRSLI